MLLFVLYGLNAWMQVVVFYVFTKISTAMGRSVAPPVHQVVLASSDDAQRRNMSGSPTPVCRGADLDRDSFCFYTVEGD
jgi:hypothetical protein